MSEIDPIEFGELRAEVNALKEQLTEQRADIKKLLAMANQGRGGLWMFMSISGLMGAVATYLGEHFLKG